MMKIYVPHSINHENPINKINPIKINKLSLVWLYCLMLLVLPFSLSAQGKWEWQNPKPQGNNLNSVYFLNADTGYTVGDAGTIMKTTDGGSNWELKESGTTNHLRSVHFTDSNTGYAVGYNGYIIKTIDGGSNWIPQSSGTTNLLECVLFMDSNTGYAVGDSGSIMKTIDGGSNWMAKNSGTLIRLKSVYFTDSSTGYVVGDLGAILKTIDGGSNWAAQSSGTSNYLQSVYFTDPNKGYIVGDLDTILITSDGGSNWTVQTNGTSNNLWSVHFTGSDTGYTVGDGGSILKTTDGGTSWIAQTSGTTNGLVSVYFISSNIGYAVGLYGTILKTTNGGSNWTSQNIGTTENLRSIFFADSKIGYTVAYKGTILKTIDGGLNWISQISGTTNNLWSVFFTDSNIGYAVGINGTILKTTNGGSNWSPQISGTAEILTSVYFIDSITGYVVGNIGTILKTADGGVNWSPQTSGTSATLYSVYFIDSNIGYSVANYGAILKTTDGGSNWTNQASGTNQWLYSVYFTDSITGYAVGSSGTILKTADGGSNWKTQNSGTTVTLRNVYFIDLNTGYAVGGEGTILKTTDQGSNWTEQISGTNMYLNSVFFTSPNNGWVVGTGSTILKYTGDSTQVSTTTSISNPSDTLNLTSVGITMIFDSTKTILSDSNLITVTKHLYGMDSTLTQNTIDGLKDTIATVFQKNYWNISSMVDTFEADISFEYDSNTFNTKFRQYLSMIYQKDQFSPWQLIESVPRITGLPLDTTARTTISFTTNHWSNWAIALAKPDALIRLDTLYTNSTGANLAVEKTFTGTGLSLSFNLAPAQTENIQFKRYDINPGGNLPSDIATFKNVFWDFYETTDTLGIYVDVSTIPNYVVSDTGAYRILHRKDAISDWVELLTFRVKKGMKEELYSYKSGDAKGHYCIGLSTQTIPLFQTYATTDSACANDTLHFAGFTANGTPPFEYTWQGEGGMAGTGQNFSWVYTTQGTYAYTLVVKDSNGVKSSFDGAVLIDCVTGENALENNPQFSIFPNPAGKGGFYVVLDVAKSDAYTIEVMNLMGKNVYTSQSLVKQGKNQVKVELAEVVGGVYFVKVTDGKGRGMMGKVVVGGR